MRLVDEGQEANNSRLPRVASQPSTGMGRPSAITNARPRAKDSIASVAMKGHPPAVMRMPDTTPAKDARGHTGEHRSHMGTPAVVAVQPVTMPTGPRSNHRQVDATADDHERHTKASTAAPTPARRH
ncbi:hypothetical protein GS433_22440 [Rhodococcus hoagii]|nr:hypothetical protein [Prescottella equi]